MKVNSFIVSTTGKDDPRFQDLYVFHGKSAYQAAVENGYEGTEEEWLAEMFELRFGTLESFADNASALLYIDTSRNHLYRYDIDKAAYIQIGVPLGETETTAYRGDRGKIAYDHSQKDHDFLYRKGGSMTGDIQSMNIIPVNSGKYSLGSAEKVYANIYSTIFTGNLTGNADSATKLQVAKTINGTLFNGTSDITTEKWGTVRNITIGDTTKPVDGSTAVSWTIEEMGVSKVGHTHLYAGSNKEGGAANSALKLETERIISLSGAITGSVAFNGSEDVTIETSVNHTHLYAGSEEAGGAANSALKLAKAITINGTSFNGTTNIITEKWGIGRNFHISDNSGTNKGTGVPVTGESDVTLLLPEIIKATLKGHADSATKASQDGNGNVIVDTYVSKTDFNANNKSITSQIETRVPSTRTVNGKELSENIEITASDVGADASGTAENVVATHNAETTAHNDIRLLITGLNERINSLMDSDDETLDQMSEVVAYIKDNKSLIESITITKVNVSDIIDNLITNVTNKPLSAAQGVALKALIDALQTEVNSKAGSENLTSHTSDTNIHITPEERRAWSAKADVTSNVASATKLETARNISIGGVSKLFDGTVDLSWSLADIGAFSVNGGALNGNVDSMNIYPSAASTYALGSSSKMYKEVHTNDLKIYSGTTLAGRFYTNGEKVTYLEIGSAEKSGSTSELVLWYYGTKNTIYGTNSEVSISLPSNSGTLALTTDNVASATKLQTARSISIGGVSKSFDGTTDLSWTLDEIGAAHSNVDTLTPFITQTNTYFVNKAMSWESTSFKQHVILLLPVLTVSNKSYKNFIDGKFLFRKMGGNEYDTVEIGINCVYNQLKYHLEYYGDSSVKGWQLCVCSYNGIKYYALLCPYRANPYNQVDFVGHIISELSGGTNEVALPFDVAYKQEANSEANIEEIIYNAEVNDSLTTELTTDIVTSVVDYPRYFPSGLVGDTYGTHNGNATSATKLEIARNITIGDTTKSFNGEANVSWSPNEIGFRYDWDCIVKIGTWSRLCHVETPYNIEGTRFILQISATRNDVVVNDLYVITAHHNSMTRISKIAGCSYSQGYQIRALANDQGSCYVELYDNLADYESIVNEVYHCKLIPLACGTITKYELFTDATTLPTDYTIGKVLTNQNSDFQGSLVGTASEANKLVDTVDVGDAKTPTYFANGLPVACDEGIFSRIVYFTTFTELGQLVDRKITELNSNKCSNEIIYPIYVGGRSSESNRINIGTLKIPYVSSSITGSRCGAILDFCFCPKLYTTTGINVQLINTAGISIRNLKINHESNGGSNSTNQSFALIKMLRNTECTSSTYSATIEAENHIEICDCDITCLIYVGSGSSSLYHYEKIFEIESDVIVKNNRIMVYYRAGTTIPIINYAYLFILEISREYNCQLIGNCISVEATSGASGASVIGYNLKDYTSGSSTKDGTLINKIAMICNNIINAPGNYLGTYYVYKSGSIIKTYSNTVNYANYAK